MIAQPFLVQFGIDIARGAPAPVIFHIGGKSQFIDIPRWTARFVVIDPVNPIQGVFALAPGVGRQAKLVWRARDRCVLQRFGVARLHHPAQGIVSVAQRWDGRVVGVEHLVEEMALIDDGVIEAGLRAGCVGMGGDIARARYRHAAEIAAGQAVVETAAPAFDEDDAPAQSVGDFSQLLMPGRGVERIGEIYGDALGEAPRRHPPAMQVAAITRARHEVDIPEREALHVAVGVGHLEGNAVIVPAAGVAVLGVEGIVLPARG